MTTTAVRVEHPSAVKGRARAYWLAGHTARLGLKLACLAALAWAASRPALTDLPGAYVLLALGAVLAGWWAVQRFRWLAWAEVPGAWRIYKSAEEAAASAPDWRADRWFSVLHSAVTVAGGLYIAHLPGDAPRAVVGLLGGGMAALFGGRLCSDLASGSFRFGRAAIIGWLVAAAPAITWAIAGDSGWARQGMVIALPMVLIWGLLRYVRIGR
ncbi:hypothetical protein [Arsenicicoccus sp. UBA7492]|uniref:hypothetical protein n=1 Tax=Arsenicicoccus sp. UBA7492 TaxID=1946057 RepID=UPI002580552D|nr:hypothetical protein [Arsenicicoccus sp. UBA7492]